MQLAPQLMLPLYDQYIIELCAAKQQSQARHLLQGSAILKTVYQKLKPLRYEALLQLATVGQPFSAALAYPDARNRDIVRVSLADNIDAVIVEAPSNILLALISDALRWRGLHPDLSHSGSIENVDSEHVWRFLPKQFVEDRIRHEVRDSALGYPARCITNIHFQPGSHF